MPPWHLHAMSVVALCVSIGQWVSVRQSFRPDTQLLGTYRQYRDKL